MSLGNDTKTRFAMIRPGAIFYNGRGTTVVQDALLGALRSGKMGGRLA